MSIFAGLIIIHIIYMEDSNKLNIELDSNVAQGSYSNLAIISHSPNEFVIDFIRVLPGMSKAQVGNRIIMTPENTKRLVMALQDNLDKFENEFGEITIHDQDNNNPIAFGISNAKA